MFNFKNNNKLLGDLPKTYKDNNLFEESSLKAIRAAHRRKWTAIIALFLLFCSGIGIWMYNKKIKKNEVEIVTEFMQAENAFEKIQEDFYKQIQEMQSKDPQAFNNGKFPEPNYSEVSGKYLEFSKKFPNHPLGWLAAIKVAGMDIEKNKYEEALNLLLPLLPKTYKHMLIQCRVRRTLAAIYIEKGEFDKALTELDFLEKLPDNPILSNVKILKAKVYHLQGKKDEATKLFNELMLDPDKAVSTEATLWKNYWGY